MIGGPMVELTGVHHVGAGHRPATPALSEAANAALYGPCARPHGHNYYVEVTVAGRPDPVTGMAVDLAALDAAVDRVVISRVDHRTLEAVPELGGGNTTGEGLAGGGRGDGQEPLRVRGRSPMIPRLIAELLKELGEDPHREGLAKTPERVAQAFRYLTSGYDPDVKEGLEVAPF